MDKKKVKFTDNSIKGKDFAPKESTYEVWEDGYKGFGLRVRPTGKKSWVFLYRFDGKPRRMTLGEYPKVSLADAHLKHAQAVKQLEMGVDPGRTVQNEKAETKKAPTVDILIGDFIEYCKVHKGNRSWQEYQRNLEKDVSPAIGHLKVKNVTRRDIVILQDQVIARGSLNQSRQVFKIVRRMFNWAVEEALIDYSPCVGIKPKAAEKKKDRFLSDEEIKGFWRSLDKAFMSDPVRRALLLVLVTAQRPGEVAGAHSSEIEGSWWTIPAARSKNKRAHRVFLTPLAKRLFGVGREGYLLPSPFDAEKPIEPLGVGKALRRSLTGKEQYGGKLKEPPIPLPAFTPHDLRRTAATHMGKLGYSATVGKVLNHTDNSVTAIYNQYDFDSEKRRALLVWSRKLKRLIAKPQPKRPATLASSEAAKVIPIRRRKAS